MTELNALNDLDFKTLEEVALHSRVENPEEGVPAKFNVAVKLVATGHANFKDCSYIQYLKNPELYSGIVLTKKGRKVADETHLRELKVIEEKHDGLLKSLEAKSAKV